MQNSDHDFCSRQGTFLTAQGRWCYKTCHSFALGDHVVIPIEIEERIRSDSHWESLSLSAGRKARCAWNLDFISSTLWLSNFPTLAQERLRSHSFFDNATHLPRLLTVRCYIEPLMRLGYIYHLDVIPRPWRRQRAQLRTSKRRILPSGSLSKKNHEQ